MRPHFFNTLFTDIFKAIDDNDMALLAYFIKKGHALKKFRDDTPLIHAAKQGHVRAVNALVPHSNANAKNKQDVNALMAAAFNGHVDAVKNLLPVTKDADQMASDGATALIKAAQQGHVDCVKALMPVSDLNRQDRYGRTALIWAAKEGHSGCVQALIPHADPNVTDKSEGRRWGGLTALMHALQNNDVSCVKLLLPVSDLSLADPAGNTVLNRCIHAHQTEFVKHIVRFSQEKADREEQMESLTLAAQSGDSEMVEALLPHSEKALMEGFSRFNQDDETPENVFLDLGSPDLEAFREQILRYILQKKEADALNNIIQQPHASPSHKKSL